MPTPRLILAGGGDAPDSHPLDALFAGWIGPGGRLLYLPVATGNPAGYRDDLVWVSAIFRPLGVGAIEMWTTLAGRDAGHLTNFDGIYIGGGNTFHLLDLLRRIIDFCAGLTYALDGSMDKAASGVYLLTPANVSVSAEDRRLMADPGLEH